MSGNFCAIEKHFVKTLVVLFVAVLLFSPFSAEAQDTGWGHLKGKIIVEGDIPDADELTVDTDDRRYCLATGQSFADNSLVVSEDGALRDAFVMMYFGRRDRNRPAVHPSYEESATAKIKLDNRNCRFSPKAIFVRRGQSIEFVNSDRIGHNCHIQTFGFEDNYTLGAGQTVEVDVQPEKTPSLPGVVTCDAHRWMESILLIRDEPYAAITDEEGNFLIENIPAGEWSFQFWHKRPGYLKTLKRDGNEFLGKRAETKLEIADGETLDLGTLVISADFMLEKE